MAQAQEVTIVASPQQIRQNLVGAMHTYYTSFPSDSAPDLNDFEAAYPIFLTDLQKNINRFNRDEAAIEGDESSAFRQIWNDAAPSSSLTQANQTVVQENGQLDPETATAFDRFVHFSNQDRASLATNFNQTGNLIPVLNEALKAVLLDQRMQHAVAARIETIDPALVSAELNEHIAHVQSHFGIEATGEFNIQTQELINQTLIANNIALNGSLANDTNAAKELQARLQQRVDELRQETLDEFEKSKAEAQTKIITDAGFSEHDAETIIDLLDNSETQDIARRNLQDTMSSHSRMRDDASKDQFIDLLWAFEMQEDIDAKGWSGSVINKLDRDEKALFSINSVMQHIHTGSIDNSLETIAGVNNSSPSIQSDSFFRPEVYDALKAGKPIDGTFLPEPYKQPGYMYSPQAIAEISYDLMQERLAERNIAPQDLTRSILEGTFIPNFDDLKLVEKSFGRPSLEEIIADPYYKGELAIMIDIGMIKVPESSQSKYGFDPENATHSDCLALLDRMDSNDNLSNHISQTLQTAPDYVFGNIINVHQSRSMNSEFGSFKNLEAVTTTRHAANEAGDLKPIDAKLEGADFALNILASNGNARFKSLYGIDPDTAHHVIEANQQLPTKLQEAIDRTLESSSVVSYYETGERHRNIHSSNFRADYAVMRDKYVEEQVLPTADTIQLANSPDQLTV